MANYTNGVKLDNGDIYEVIPTVATNSRIGGIKADSKTATETLEVKIGTDNKLYTKSYDEDITNLQTQIDELAKKPATTSNTTVGNAVCFCYGSTAKPIVGVATEVTE